LHAGRPETGRSQGRPRGRDDERQVPALQEVVAGDPAMTRPLDGKVVALAEGRQLEDLARLLQAEGAVPLRCPMLSILDAPEAEPVVAWLRELIAGRFDLVVLMTGEAVRRLAGFAERAGLRDD